MKKRIIFILLILIVLIISTIILLKKYPNEISEKEFYKLIKFEVDDEEKIKIIDNPMTMDTTTVTWYNIDFNKKEVISLSRTTRHMPGETGESFSKYEYQLTNKQISSIKDKIEQIKKLDIEEETKNSLLNGEYTLITKDGQKRIPNNHEAAKLIKDIEYILFDI